MDCFSTALSENVQMFGNKLLKKSPDKSQLENKSYVERSPSCDTSDCSFEMDSNEKCDDLHLCSIDELFASPPTVHDSDGEQQCTTATDNVRKDFSLIRQSQSITSSSKTNYYSNLRDENNPSKHKAETGDIGEEQNLNGQTLQNCSPAESNNTTSDIGSPLLCVNCQKEKPKYKCPQCLRRTCSLACVKHHKQQFDCQGERDKAEFVRKENFTESHFLSDYRFLEEVNRCATKRDHLPRAYFKTTGMKVLMKKAYNIGIHLKLLPLSFKRRKMNSTYYCFKNRRFLWHVDWNFVSADVTVSDHRLPESTSLTEGVRKHIEPSTSEDRYNPRLNDYHKAEELNFYMRKERTPANQELYHKLDGKGSLQSNLKGKIIVEYPVIFVALPNQSRKFELSLFQ